MIADKQKDDKKYRITLDVDQQFYTRLEKLRKTVRTSSKADLIRQALRVYEYLAYKAVKGDRFQVTDNSGNTTEIVLLEVSPSQPQLEKENEEVTA